MTTPSNDDTTPDELMEHFHGRSFKAIVIFTIAAHAVLLLGTSLPFLWKSFAGSGSAGASEDERIESAVREATASLREIAEEHGLNPEDISNQFSGGAPRRTSTPAEAGAGAEPTTPAAGTDPPAATGGGTGEGATEPASAIEKEIDVKATGPSVPPVDDEEDLFK